MTGRLLISLRSAVRYSGIRYSSQNSNYGSSKPLDSIKYIDMRSDTVTMPSMKMKEAILNAKLGDDVYGEDPTVLALEQRCADLFEKDSAIFVASGTMGNLMSIMAHCQRGEELIVGRQNHIHKWEQANYAQLAGVSATTLNTQPDGTILLSEIEESIRYSDPHMPISKLICLETSHNYCGGVPLSLEYLSEVRDLATRNGLRIHIDGARIYNAAVAMGVSVSDIAKYGESVMMCFSKGLGAPVGSIVVGTHEFITEARRRRKALGGGWRQAGMLAAAAMVALDEAVSTVTKDHEHARILARSINDLTPNFLKNSLFVNEDNMTNMVLLQCGKGISPEQVADYFEKFGILVMAFDEKRVRIVPNWNVTGEDISKTIDVYDSFIELLS